MNVTFERAIYSNAWQTERDWFVEGTLNNSSGWQKDWQKDS